MNLMHVNPGGSSSDGGDAGVFSSLVAARDAIRQMRCRQGLPEGGVTVILHAGEYALGEPFVLTQADSGSSGARISYQAADGETVRILGGRRVQGWAPVTDPAVLERLPAAARTRIRVADLRAQGIADLGTLESAPKWAESDPGLEVFCNGQRLPMARFPKEGFLQIDTVVEFDGEHPRLHVPLSRKGHFRVKPEQGLDVQRLERWQSEPHAMCHGYWFYDWADQHYRVDSVDPAKAEIRLADAVHAHHYGFRPGQWFYAYNLLCELEAPGEWYLDREAGLLYVLPPAGVEAEGMEVSVVRDPWQFEDASHITLRGVTLDIMRGTGIRVAGGEAIHIDGCTVCNAGKDGIRVDGGLRHRVTDCTVHDTGDGGIYLIGGERRTLTPAGHEAVNNHIYRTSRWNPLYHVGIQLAGVGNRAAHNRVHDVPHVAIGFTGNDQTVEYNEIYRAVYQANDAGAIYTSGAHPEDWSMRGHVIRHNYLHHIQGFRGKGCNGVYLDDMFSGTAITGNLFYRVSHPVFIGGGRDVHITGNLCIESAPAIHIDDRATNWAADISEVLANTLAMPIAQEPWASRYPELVSIEQDEPALPKGNRVERNINWKGAWDDMAPLARAHARIRQNLFDADPQFVDEARCDFRLKPASPAWELGFEPLPLERIGLQPSVMRPVVPPRTMLDVTITEDESPGVFKDRCVKPGVIRVRVRNIGDTTYRGTVRVRMTGGGLPDGDRQDVQLAPFESCELPFAVVADGTVHAAVLAEQHEGELACRVIDPQLAGVTDWPEALRVSVLHPGGGDLAGLAAVPKDLQWRVHATDPALGFCNLHPELAAVGEADATVFIGCRVRCPEAMRVAVRLGYDGPIKAFMDGQPIFHDPEGRPPAHPDQAAPECVLAQGDHDLVIALSANRGQSWGVFLRIARVDRDAELMRSGATLLPEIRPE